MSRESNCSVRPAAYCVGPNAFGEVHCFGARQGTVSNSAERRRAAQRYRPALGSLVLGEGALFPRTGFPLDEVVQEVRELLSQVAVSQYYVLQFAHQSHVLRGVLAA